MSLKMNAFPNDFTSSVFDDNNNQIGEGTIYAKGAFFRANRKTAWRRLAYSKGRLFGRFFKPPFLQDGRKTCFPAEKTYVLRMFENEGESSLDFAPSPYYLHDCDVEDLSSEIARSRSQ